MTITTTTSSTTPGGASALTVGEAYAQCAAIVGREAKNFAYGIRLLRRDERNALSAVYAMSRRIDDIGDGDIPVEQKRRELDAVRASIAALRDTGVSPDPRDPVLVALADVARCYAVPLSAFEELVDGCERDLTGEGYKTFDDLVGYCRLVAGSVGRLSLGVFGVVRPVAPGEAERRADALGVALQITNILRDIVEDRDQMGRIYLPTEDIERFGCAPDLSGPVDAVAALVVFEAARAREWYRDGLSLLPLLDHRCRACVGAMAGIYRRLLTRIEADPAAVLRTRVSLPTHEKLGVALRALAGRVPRE
ncbi:MAG TPA: squalene/phytoene synthase family protein [Acidimicrobiales bacterium]